ncbi:DUF6508 domain-containing protein [Paenibacillus thiaminolyticus]|nr:DUF6508 domain-containing protein [Paenibacillus thiaminolyticus]
MFQFVKCILPEGAGHRWFRGHAVLSAASIAIILLELLENQLQSVDEHSCFIERASIEELRKLMTAYVRQERFCEGFLTDVMRRGWVGKVLDRLQALTVE